MSGVCRFPAALVALILGGTSRLGFAALGAELALVHRAAAASPAVSSGLRLRLFAAAFRAELAGDGSAATALPAVGGRSLLLGCCGLLPHGEQALGVHAVCTGCHAHAHKAGHSTGGVPSSSLHGIDLTTHQTGGSGGGVGGHGVFFPLGDLLLLLLRDGQGVDVEGEHLDAALFAPDIGQLLVEGVRDLQRVGGDLVILHLVGRKSSQRRLQSVQQLALQPGCDLGCVILGGDVAAHVGVEQQRVADAVSKAAVAADIHRELVAPLLADHHPERDGRCGAVQDLAQLLGVDVVHPLILAGVAAVGKALGYGLEGSCQTVAEVAGEHAGLGGCVKGEFARFGAHLHHAALLHDEHALSVCHGDAAAVGDDVVLAVVGAAAGGALLALDHQHILIQRIAIEKFFPLICKSSAQCAHTCFDQTHNNFLLYVLLFLLSSLSCRTISFVKKVLPAQG